MKRLLIVTATFPPVGGVGVFRVTKFCKYLRDFGWEPIILTQSPELFPNRDEGFLRDLPDDLQVHRTGVAAWVPFSAREKKWLPVVLKSADRLAREQRFHAVMISGPPFYPSLVGPRLRARYGLPYLIDMRDAWHLDPYHTPARFADRIDKCLSGWMEPRVIRHASAVLCASPYTMQDYLAHYGDRADNPEGIVYLPNGYDPDDFADLDPVPAEPLRMIYAGKLVVGRKTDPFLTALRDLIRGADLTPEALEFVFIGDENRAFREKVAGYGLTSFFRFTGYMPYRECLRWCKGADLLVVFSSGVRHEPTTKIFDYIGCRRPIMVLGAGDGILAEYCREFDSPNLQLVGQETSGEILAALKSVYENREQHRGRPVTYNAEIERRYNRRELTRKLAGHLNEAASDRSG